MANASVLVFEGDGNVYSSKVRKMKPGDVLLDDEGNPAFGSTDIEYDNSTSGLTADNVQMAIDEVAEAAGAGGAGTVTYTVSSELDQLSIAGIHKGDICIRTDIQKTYRNLNGDNATMADWAELPAKGTQTALEVDYNNIVSGLTADNVQEAIDELDGDLNNLAATSVSFDDSGTDITADNVQAALEALDSKPGTRHPFGRLLYCMPDGILVSEGADGTLGKPFGNIQEAVDYAETNLVPILEVAAYDIAAGVATIQTTASHGLVSGVRISLFYGSYVSGLSENSTDGTPITVTGANTFTLATTKPNQSGTGGFVHPRYGYDLPVYVMLKEGEYHGQNIVIKRDGVFLFGMGSNITEVYADSGTTLTIDTLIDNYPIYYTGVQGIYFETAGGNPTDYAIYCRGEGYPTTSPGAFLGRNYLFLWDVSVGNDCELDNARYTGFYSCYLSNVNLIGDDTDSKYVWYMQSCSISGTTTATDMAYIHCNSMQEAGAFVLDYTNSPGIKRFRISNCNSFSNITATNVPDLQVNHMNGAYFSGLNLTGCTLKAYQSILNTIVCDAVSTINLYGTTIVNRAGCNFNGAPVNTLSDYGADQAGNIEYDNGVSGLVADDVQAAIDEVAAGSAAMGIFSFDVDLAAGAGNEFTNLPDGWSAVYDSIGGKITVTHNLAGKIPAFVSFYSIAAFGDYNPMRFPNISDDLLIEVIKATPLDFEIKGTGFTLLGDEFKVFVNLA